MKFVGKAAMGQTRYEVFEGDKKLGEVYSDRPTLWVASDGRRTWSAGTRRDAARFLRQPVSSTPGGSS